jgi:hypothetical protein
MDGRAHLLPTREQADGGRLFSDCGLKSSLGSFNPQSEIRHSPAVASTGL